MNAPPSVPCPWYTNPFRVGLVCLGLVALLGAAALLNYYRVVSAIDTPARLSHELRREAIWWGAAAAAAFVYAALGVYLLNLSLGGALRAARLLLLMSGALLGPTFVYWAIELTKSREGFECILPGPVLSWSSTVVAAGFIIFVAWRRRAAA